MTIFDFIEQLNIFDIFLALLPYPDTMIFQLSYLIVTCTLFLIAYFYAPFLVRIVVTIGTITVVPMVLLSIVKLLDNGLITGIIFIIIFSFCLVIFWQIEEYIEQAVLAVLGASLLTELALQRGILGISAEGIRSSSSGTEGLLLHIAVLLIGSAAGALFSVFKFKDLFYIFPGVIISTMFLSQIFFEIAVRLSWLWYIDLYLSLGTHYVMAFLLSLFFGLLSLGTQLAIWLFLLIESDMFSVKSVSWYAVTVIGVSTVLYLVSHLPQSTVDSLNQSLQSLSQEQEIVEARLLDPYRGDPSTTQPTYREWHQPDTVLFLELTELKRCPHLSDCRTLSTMQAGEYLIVWIPEIFGQDIAGNNIWHFSHVEIENEGSAGVYFHSESVIPCNPPFRFSNERNIDYGVECVEPSN